MRSLSFILIAGLLGSAAPPRRSSTPPPAASSAAWPRPSRMGMTVKMDPEAFKAGLDKSCKAEETGFRAAAIKQAVAQGRTEAEAVVEVEGNSLGAGRLCRRPGQLCADWLGSGIAEASGSRPSVLAVAAPRAPMR